LKLVHRDISSPLSDIFNLSFTTGLFPSTLKLSKVIPIFKKGSPLETSNYRPISLLSNIEKIFEKLMYSRLISFLDSYSIIYRRQYGFRKSHSTIHALIKSGLDKVLIRVMLLSGILSIYKKHLMPWTTLDHSILLSNLTHYGVRGIVNKWFKSYSSRLQFVSVFVIVNTYLYLLAALTGSSLR